MDEEQMWKGFYTKLQEMKLNPPTEHDAKLQDADGGFFEKFGSLLRQKSCMEEETHLAPLEDYNTQQETLYAEEEDENGQEHYANEKSQNELNTCAAEDVEEMDCAPLELLEMEQDLRVPEDFQAERKEEILEKSVGLNIEDLYEEVLYEIVNNVGYESDKLSHESLMEFVQDAFKMTNAKHEELLQQAHSKEPPSIRLNVEIVKAENLLAKDADGSSDPFVTLYLESDAGHRYNTSVKSKTLDPIWEEHFSLPIMESPRHEVLIVEVWDFDAAETAGEKVNKIMSVKGIKGLSKLMKEIAMTASATGKHDNELIGRTAITLKSVSLYGSTVWYNLEKGSKNKSRGSILVNLALSAEKNKIVAVQEHRHLLKLLLLHELETSQVANYWWCGKFGVHAQSIKLQHAVQSGLSNFECSLSEWHVYAQIHEDHPLSFTLFNTLLDVIIPVLKCHLNETDDLKTFWDGVRRILPSCFSVLRKLRAKNVSDKQIIKTLCEILDIFAKIKSLEPKGNVELFPAHSYAWLTRESEDSEYTIDGVIVQALQYGSKEWLQCIAEVNKTGDEEETDEEQLQYLIKVVQMVRSDLQRSMEYFDKHFYHKIKLNFSQTLAKFYDKHVTEITQRVIKTVCGNIKRLEVPDDNWEELPNIEEANMGTTLFEAYLILKRFLALVKSLCPEDTTLAIAKFHTWFMPGVAHWLAISIIKALNRIDKAIELDELKAVDETVKYSSSAVDTLSIFYQIKIFWQQLDWPDVEGLYTFIAKIVDDICRCCIFYAQKMSRKVELLTAADNDTMFHVTTEWCLAINNIDYIRQSLPQFIKELGVDDVIRQLAADRSDEEAARCATTMKNVADNALDTQRNQVLELIEIVARKMNPAIRRFLAEGAEALDKDSNSMEQLMMYMEKSLATLYETLNEVNFARILDAIWTELSNIIYDLIKTNLDKGRPPTFFQNLRKTMRVMISCFKTNDVVTSDVLVLEEIERLLETHGCETTDLIHHYYLERFGFQKCCEKSEYGQLTIRASFDDTGLNLHLLNARNLLPMDSNGSCDPFIKVSFLPVQRFVGAPAIKTAVHNKTRFPLFDEVFHINLSPEQLQHTNNLIVFSIRDKDLLTSQYLAECYITFADLMGYEGEQLHMELSRPAYTDSDTVKALECRQNDKLARDFVKKLRTKWC